MIADNLEKLVEGMNGITAEGAPQIDVANLRRVIEDRDSQLDNKFSKDAQINYIRTARGYLGDKIVRCAAPHRLLDESKVLIAVRLRILTRKTLGGIETDLSGRCVQSDGSVLPGLYAAGEAAGFGGGGMHGKNALEGTFLGGCIHSGKRVGRLSNHKSKHCEWSLTGRANCSNDLKPKPLRALVAPMNSGGFIPWKAACPFSV